MSADIVEFKSRKTIPDIVVRDYTIRVTVGKEYTHFSTMGLSDFTFVDNDIVLDLLDCINFVREHTCDRPK
jgi:hypothetical protein